MNKKLAKKLHESSSKSGRSGVSIVKIISYLWRFKSCHFTTSKTLPTPLILQLNSSKCVKSFGLCVVIKNLRYLYTYLHTYKDTCEKHYSVCLCSQGKEYNFFVQKSNSTKKLSHKEFPLHNSRAQINNEKETSQIKSIGKREQKKSAQTNQTRILLRNQ